MKNNHPYIHKGKIIPIDAINVDTDKIIPAKHLTTISKKGLGRFLFDQVKKENSECFPIDNPLYKNSTIMLCRENFGCGSSREHAVWAIQDTGFKVLIGNSFSDIFINNCQLNGVWIIKLRKQFIDKMFEKSKKEILEIEVNIKDCHIKLQSGEKERLKIDPFYKNIFMHGLDPIEFLVEKL